MDYILLFVAPDTHTDILEYTKLKAAVHTFYRLEKGGTGLDRRSPPVQTEQMFEPVDPVPFIQTESSQKEKILNKNKPTPPRSIKPGGGL